MPQRMPTLVLVSLVLGLVFASAQVRSQRNPPILPVAGVSIFQNYCAPCHGLDGRGRGPVTAALRSEVPDLTRLAQRNGGVFPALHVRRSIILGEDELIPAHGSKAMPIWGPVFHEIDFDRDLGNVKLENITKYLESIQRN
jgi:mono/diheme cytochrome c family protein